MSENTLDPQGDLIWFLKEKLDAIDQRLAAIEFSLYGPKLIMDGRRFSDGSLETRVSDLESQVGEIDGR